jgi:hypothetical protein
MARGMFKARGTRAFKFPRTIINNYARGTYNVLFYFIISKRFKQTFSKLKVVSMQILVLCRKFAVLMLLGLLCSFKKQFVFSIMFDTIV